MNTARGRFRKESTGTHCKKDRTMKDIVFTIDYLGQKWDKVPFQQAATVLRNHIYAEQKVCQEWFRQQNKEGILAGTVSFWSQFMGGACKERPTDADWNTAKDLLAEANAAYNAKDTLLTIHKFVQAECAFKSAHQKYIRYHESLQFGAKVAIGAMKVTIMVLSAAVSCPQAYGPAAAKSVATGVSAKAFSRLAARSVVSGCMKIYESSASSVGLYLQGLEKDTYVDRILLDGAKGFITSLLAGSMAIAYKNHVKGPLLDSVRTMADGAIARYLEPLPRPKLEERLFDFMVDHLSRTGVNTLTEAIEAAAQKTKGGKLDTESFVKRVADETTARLALSEAWKAFIVSAAKHSANAPVL